MLTGGRGRIPIEVEVQMVVEGAAGIEIGAASRTDVVAVEVSGDGQLRPADSAQHGPLVELGSRPSLRGMVFLLGVTRVARVVTAAAPELDRDDVGGPAPVDTAGLVVE